MDAIRINKYIADCGYCSRSKADKLISLEIVKVNGNLAKRGQLVEIGDVVSINGEIITPLNEYVYLLLNKPIGVVCTMDKTKKCNLSDFLNLDYRVFPVGRLDKDTSGLLLLTNDGSIVNKMMHYDNKQTKEYLVKVDKPIDDEFINKMQNGVTIYNPNHHQDELTLPCVVEKTDNDSFKISLTQGLNRQIRRMCKALGYNVITLKRIRIINITDNKLKEGEIRNLNKNELEELFRLIKK